MDVVKGFLEGLLVVLVALLMVMLSAKVKGLLGG